jgi:hypothetical protein
MTAPNKHIAAGTQLAFLGLVDSQGFFLGKTASTAQNKSEGMIRLSGIQTANPGPIEGEDVPVEGDDAVLGKFQFAAADTPSFIANTGVFDLTTDALLQGTSVESLGDIRIGVAQPNDPVYADACMIIQGKAKSFDDGNVGVSAWMGYIIPLLTAQPLGRETFEGRTAASNRVKVVTQAASRKPWGVTITTAVLGTTGAPLLPFTADNPLTMHYFRGNAAIDTVTLDFTPVSQAKVIIHKETQLLTAGVDFTVNTSTKVVTFTSPPAANTRCVILYEFSA